MDDPHASGYRVIEADVRVGRGEAYGIGLSSMPPELAWRLAGLRAWPDRRRALTGARLLRVIEVGETVVRQAASVELVALEVRESGALAAFRWHADGPVAGGPALVLADVAATDDLGTAYALEGGAWGNSSGGEAECLVDPGPPDGAHVLRITVERLAVVALSAGRGTPAVPAVTTIEGPWGFDVRL